MAPSPPQVSEDLLFLRTNRPSTPRPCLAKVLCLLSRSLSSTPEDPNPPPLQAPDPTGKQRHPGPGHDNSHTAEPLKSPWPVTFKKQRTRPQQHTSLDLRVWVCVCRRLTVPPSQRTKVNPNPLPTQRSTSPSSFCLPQSRARRSSSLGNNYLPFPSVPEASCKCLIDLEGIMKPKLVGCLRLAPGNQTN